MSLQVGQKCYIGSKTGTYDSRWKDAVFVVIDVATGMRNCQTGTMVEIVTEDERVPVPSRHMTLDLAWIQPIIEELNLFDEKEE